MQHEHTGLLVGNDPAEAAAALVRLSREPDLLQRCSTQSRALVEAGYGADQCFERWLGVIEQAQGATTVQFPMNIAKLRRVIPLADHRFQAQYDSTGWPSNKLHMRRVVIALKRRIGI